MFRLSNAKLTAGIFVGPDIRKLEANEAFLNALSEDERKCFDQIMTVVRQVLTPCNVSIELKKAAVDSMIKSLVKCGCNYSPKMHCVHCHFDEIFNRQFSVSDEHGERIHQTMRLIEERFIGKCQKSMLCEYIWSECA